MNHTQRIAICEVCKNKEFSPKKGIVCTLTSERPAFEGTCSDYVNDPKMVARKEREAESRKNLSSVDGGGDLAEADKGGTTPWGVIVGVIVVLLILLKWLIRCDRIMN